VQFCHRYTGTCTTHEHYKLSWIEKVTFSFFLRDIILSVDILYTSVQNSVYVVFTNCPLFRTLIWNNILINKCAGGFKFVNCRWVTFFLYYHVVLYTWSCDESCVIVAYLYKIGKDLQRIREDRYTESCLRCYDTVRLCRKEIANIRPRHNTRRHTHHPRTLPDIHSGVHQESLCTNFQDHKRLVDYIRLRPHTIYVYKKKI